jgi:hypothetical protein
VALMQERSAAWPSSRLPSRSVCVASTSKAC